MRALALTSLFVLAACSEGGEDQPQKKAKAAAAKQIEPGQWETTLEVTRLTKLDQGQPKINTPAGAKTTGSACVTAADARKPPTAVFTGSDAGTCKYQDLYMSGGRINGSVACTRPGLDGEILTSIEGTFTADTIQGETQLATRLASDGDVRISYKLAARRTGDCAG